MKDDYQHQTCHNIMPNEILEELPKISNVLRVVEILLSLETIVYSVNEPAVFLHPIKI